MRATTRTRDSETPRARTGKSQIQTLCFLSATIFIAACAGALLWLLVSYLFWC